ncbi:glutamate--tRNA ligase [bacterium]|nr:glutamate--tRNA ligase [bacterium]
MITDIKEDPKESLKLIIPGQVRVRIAPSPTGPLHIGTARTALFNYLFSKKYKGKFILRIEDTDFERSKEEWIRDIREGLQWLGLSWDEGPDVGGPYGPYLQSKRFSIYQRYIKKLLDSKDAYYCFCSKEELEAHRNYLMSIGKPPRYSGKCRNLSPEKVEEYLSQNKPYVIRLKVPEKKVVFQDLIRGKIEFDSSLLGDFVVAKGIERPELKERYGDWAPLYNFACVVDDFEMKITHVIRGEDHISNTPKQILIREALELPHPKYAHIPLILNENRAKLSKRDAVVSVGDYKAKGYLPEAIINFIALCGWNPGTPREIFSLSSLVQEFSLSHIQKSGAVFNLRKLDWINGFYIRQKPLEKLTELCIPYLINAGLIEPIFKEAQYPPAYGASSIVQSYKIKDGGEIISQNYLKAVIRLYKERLKKLSEIAELTDFFFKEKLNYPKDLLKWRDMEFQEIWDVLNSLAKTLSQIKEKDWQASNLKELLLKKAEEYSKGDRGKVLWPLRVALTGKKASADPIDVAELLGKDKVLKRIKEALHLLKPESKLTFWKK